MKNEHRISHPKISLSGKEGAVYIGKDVIRLLGVPTHICLLKNSRSDSLMITCGKPDELMSFKVPEGYSDSRPSKFRIYSRQFVIGILEENHLDVAVTHVFKGEYDQKNNVIRFQIG